MARLEGVSRLRWRLHEILNSLWFRVTIFAVLGLVTAVAGSLLRDQIPAGLAGQIGAEAIEPILDIVASSMLTVTTFSLSILTAAYATASSGSTPRAVTLLVRDGVSQTVLATFIGAFVFSLVGLIMLNTELYGDGGRVVLFAVTLLVILVVIVSLLRWINRLGELGLIGDNLTRLETATAVTLHARLDRPWLGANPMRGDAPADSVPVLTPEVGHVQSCDMESLSGLAETHGLIVWMTATPGDLVHAGRPLLHVNGLPGDPDEAGPIRDSLVGCFTLRPTRSFEQDPRFGFRVLSEMGQRALSPAVNDPGTAISATVRMMRILSAWTEEVAPEVTYPRLHIRSITAEEILEDSLIPLARDGASIVEMQAALQDMLLGLVRQAPEVFGPPARALSPQLLAHGLEGLVLEADKARIRAASQKVLAEAG